jgi:hypothetical protein
MKASGISSLGSLSACLLVCILSSTSCLHNSAMRGPRTPTPLAVSSKNDLYVLNEIQNFYYGRCLQNNNPLPSTTIVAPDVWTGINCGTDRQKRDAIVHDLKMIIDHNYEDYARNFQQTADTTNLIGEVGATSLSAVSTLVGVGDLKDILSTASTLTQATNTSIQKNYFQKQTDYAILAEMNAERLKEWSQIADAMKNNDVNTYSLSAALDNLQEYKRVGTAIVALTTIGQQAGAQTVSAAADISKTAKQTPSKKSDVNATIQTTVALVQSAPAAAGITITATVAAVIGGATPTGSVTFNDGAAAIGAPVPLTAGQASLTINLSSGQHSLVVTYPGDGQFQPSQGSVTISFP